MTETSAKLETGHCGITSVLLDVFLNITFLYEGRLRTLDKFVRTLYFQNCYEALLLCSTQIRPVLTLSLWGRCN